MDNYSKNIDKILSILKDLYPNAETELNFNTPFQMLISTILSAQCTDERVNQVTKVLFKEYPDATAISKMTISDLEKIIHSTGFYHNKAKNIIESSKTIVEKYNGNIPENLDLLIKLPGVGRKTANVVLANSYGHNTITVDTHLKRVSNRLGLVDEENPEKIEFKLMELIPKNEWSKYSIRIIFHGRRVCKSRKPMCNICKLSSLCKYYKDNKIKS